MSKIDWHPRFLNCSLTSRGSHFFFFFWVPLCLRKCGRSGVETRENLQSLLLRVTTVNNVLASVLALCPVITSLKWLSSIRRLKCPQYLHSPNWSVYFLLFPALKSPSRPHPGKMLFLIILFSTRPLSIKGDGLPLFNMLDKLHLPNSAKEVLKANMDMNGSGVSYRGYCRSF